jgi:hypothetical protein
MDTNRERDTTQTTHNFYEQLKHVQHRNYIKKLQE